jgi:hypothetical protein
MCTISDDFLGLGSLRARNIELRGGAAMDSSCELLRCL